MNKIVSIFLLVLGGLVIGGILLLWPFIFRHPLFQNTVLAEHVEIGFDWIEIDTKGSVVTEKDNSYIGIVLEPPYKIPLGSRGVQTPEGNIVNPEVVLVDESGNEYKFT